MLLNLNPQSLSPRSRLDIPPSECYPVRAAGRNGLSGSGKGGAVRIVSLLPSATEIVYALGLGDSLVGVTHECDYPPAARSGRS